MSEPPPSVKTPRVYYLRFFMDEVSTLTADENRLFIVPDSC